MPVGKMHTRKIKKLAVFYHLSVCSRPGYNKKNLKIIRPYSEHLGDSYSGLLVCQKSNPFTGLKQLLLVNALRLK